MPRLLFEKGQRGKRIWAIRSIFSFYSSTRRVARGSPHSGTEGTGVNWKCSKRFALLAFPACQGDGICAVLKCADAKGGFKTRLEEWLQELSSLISFDPD